MAHRNSFIPRLESQPVSVDFIDNQLSTCHQMFMDDHTHYDHKSKKFVPDNQPLVSAPGNGHLAPLETYATPPLVTGSSPTTNRLHESRPYLDDIQAMKFWNEIFPEAMLKFKATQEPEGRSKTEYSIRDENDWDAIYNKLENSQIRYQKVGGTAGFMRRVRRKLADNAAPVTEIVKTFKAMIPDSPFSTPVAGSLQVILNAVSNAAKVRGEILQGFDDLISIFSGMETFLATFPQDVWIRNASLELTVTTLEAIERTIGFFISNEVGRGFKAVGLGDTYQSKVLESLSKIKEGTKRLNDEATRSHYYKSQMYAKAAQESITQGFETTHKQNQQIREEQATIKNTMHYLLFDYQKQREREHAIEKEKLNQRIRAAEQANLFLRVENGRLRSVSPQLQGIWTPPPPQPICDDQVDQHALRDLLGSLDIDLADISFALDKKELLPARDRTQAEQIVNAQLFQTWVTTPSSTRLLIHWDRQPPRTIANISPLSIFCATMRTILSSYDRFITSVWLSGLHMDRARSLVGGCRMIASLIDQLLRQHEFGNGLVPMDGIDLEQLQLGDLEQHISLLELLLRQLPETVTFFCIIDGVILYEHDDMQAREALAHLIRLNSDDTISAAIKLLFTSTPATTIVRCAFEKEGLILNVEGLPKLVWAPSDERFTRDFTSGLDESEE